MLLFKNPFVMKKYIVYLVILALGLLLGYLIFSGNESTTPTEKEMTAQATQLWTCSMHPQIMQPEPGDCPICGMDLIPAESGTDGLTAEQFRLTENAMALANVQTIIVGASDDGQSTVTLSGTLETNEETNAVQISYFNGRVEKLQVNFTGENVSKGQRLATIYSPELYAAQQELLTASSLKERQPKLYQAVRNKLKLWKISDTQIDQIETTGDIIENFPIYATVSGTVTEKLVELGDYVKQGQTLFKIAKLNTLWAQFDVYENQVESFEVGQEITINTNAFPDKEFKGTVAFIDPVLKSNTRTVDVRVTLENPNGQLKPGMFVQGEVSISSSKEASLIIPNSAVLWTGQRSIVYIKPYTDQSVFEMRNIVLGRKLNGGYEVLNGLKRGDEIVMNGAFTIDAAAQLQGKRSMMNTHEKVSHSKNDDSTTSNVSQPDFEADRFKVSDTFKIDLNKVLQSYLSVKDAFVASNSNEIDRHAMEFIEKWESINITKLPMEAKVFWTENKEKIRNEMEKIQNSNNLDEKRLHFKGLSPIFASIIYRYEVSERIYYQFCPMADNNTGGYWLSMEKEIKNPYFGDAMLRCGEVKQIID